MMGQCCAYNLFPLHPSGPKKKKLLIAGLKSREKQDGWNTSPLLVTENHLAIDYLISLADL